MGGDRTCPDNCFLAAWYSVPEDQRTAERRRPIVEQLAKQGYTQQAIAMQLGVDQATISRDFTTLCIVHNVQSEENKDTLGRTRSTGRPKKSSKRKRPAATKRDMARPEVARRVSEGSYNRSEVAEELGVSHHTVQDAEIEVQGYNKGYAQALLDHAIDPTSFPETIQEKLAAYKRQFDRQRQRELDAKFRSEVEAEVKRRIDQIVLPHWKEEIERADKLYKHRRGAMEKATFNMIRRALHPDSRASISNEKLAEAFDTFMSLEKFLLDEKASPTQMPDVPSSWQEWEDAKRKAAESRHKGQRKKASAQPDGESAPNIMRPR
jgi:predicted transcriptional regulator